MSKGYQPRDAAPHHIHSDSRGLLPPERLSINGAWDGPVPPGGQPSVVAVDPASDDAPHWRPMSSLLAAYLVGEIPDGSEAEYPDTYAWAFDGTEDEEWVVPHDAAQRPLALAFEAAMVAAEVTAEVPVSVVADGDAYRSIKVRLVVDGSPSAATTVSPGSNSSGGTGTTVTITDTWVLAPVTHHLVQVEVSLPAPTLDAVTAYSTGASITVEPMDAPAAGAVSGDLDGTLPDPTVAALRGRSVATTDPSDGDVLTWSEGDAEWRPAAPTGGGGATGSILMTVSGGPVMTPGGGLIVVGVS